MDGVAAHVDLTLIGADRVAPGQPDDLVTTPPQRLDEGGPDEAGAASHRAVTDGFIDLVDPVTTDTLDPIRGLGQPVVSIHLPTHRDPPDVKHDALQLRALVEEATTLLTEQGLSESEAAEILAPASWRAAPTP